MTRTVRSAVVATMIGAALLGSAGLAAATPLDGPQEQQVVDYLTALLLDFDTKAGLLGTLGDPVPTRELEATSTTYTSGAAYAGTQTVVVKVHQDLGGARPATWYRAFSYDNTAQSPLTFDRLFRPGARPLEVIAPIVARQMTDAVGQPITIDPAVGLDAANYRNFAITDDAVLFFFDRGQLHPACGATEVSVPRTAIAELLNPGR